MIPTIIAAVCIIAWCMQLWFGVAVFGRPGNHLVVLREKTPVRFWIIVSGQLAIVAVIFWYEMQAGLVFN